METGTGQPTWVVVETLNEGEDGEKVALRRIPLSHVENAYTITVDEPAVETHVTHGEYPEAPAV